MEMPSPLIYTCVAPVVVSNVSNEEASWQGGADVVGMVRLICARTSFRAPEPSSGAEKIWPEVTVKLAAVPSVAPVELRNVMVPEQDAAVPLEEFAAMFTTFTWMVSVPARPTGRKFSVRVTVVGVVVWAKPAAAVHTAHATKGKNVRRINIRTFRDLRW